MAIEFTLRKNIAEIISRNHIDTNLLLDYLIIFARFECALKACGYLRENKDLAEPSWWSFEADIKQQFDAIESPELSAAISYIESRPPRIQFRGINNSPEWRTGVFRGAIPVVEMAKQVRHNLFHGGKFNTGLIEEVARDTKLIQCSIVILNACLECNQSVKDAFFN